MSETNVSTEMNDVSVVRYCDRICGDGKCSTGIMYESYMPGLEPGCPYGKTG